MTHKNIEKTINSFKIYFTYFFPNFLFFPHLYLTSEHSHISILLTLKPSSLLYTLWLTPPIVTFCTPISLSPFPHLFTFFTHSQFMCLLSSCTHISIFFHTLHPPLFFCFFFYLPHTLTSNIAPSHATLLSEVVLLSTCCCDEFFNGFLLVKYLKKETK